MSTVNWHGEMKEVGKRLYKGITRKKRSDPEMWCLLAKAMQTFFLGESARLKTKDKELALLIGNIGQGMALEEYKATCTK